MVVLFWTKWVQSPHNQRARWKNVTGSPPTCHLHHKHRTLFNIQFLVPIATSMAPFPMANVRLGAGPHPLGGHLSNLGCWDECLNLMKICHVTRLTWMATLELGSWDKCLNLMKFFVDMKVTNFHTMGFKINTHNKVARPPPSWSLLQFVASSNQTKVFFYKNSKKKKQRNVSMKFPKREKEREERTHISQ